MRRPPARARPRVGHRPRVGRPPVQLQGPAKRSSLGETSAEGREPARRTDVRFAHPGHPPGVAPGTRLKKCGICVCKVLVCTQPLDSGCGRYLDKLARHQANLQRVPGGVLATKRQSLPLFLFRYRLVLATKRHSLPLFLFRYRGFFHATRLTEAAQSATEPVVESG